MILANVVCENWCCSVVLGCISLFMSKTEHLFILLRSIYILFLVSFAHFSVGLVQFAPFLGLVTGWFPGKQTLRLL